MRRYEQGFRDGVEAAAKALQEVSVSPEEARAHFHNAGGALRHMYERGYLKPPESEDRAKRGDPR